MTLEATPWYHAGIDRLNFAVLARRGREMLEYWPGMMGLRALPAGTRLERSTVHVEAFNRDFPRGEGLGPQHNTRAEVVAEAVRTIFDAFVVAHAFLTRPQSKRCLTRRHLGSFLEGEDREPTDSKSSARSYQFEATIIVQFALSGLTVESGEPDATLLYHGTTVGLAMKRLRTRNASSVAKRLRKGARQILDARLRGFVVLSLDPWLNDLGVDADPEAVGRAFLAEVARAYNQLGDVAQKDHVLGVIAGGTWTRWILSDGKPRFLFKSPQQVRVFTSPATEENEERQAAEFFEGMRVRWASALDEIGRHLS